MKVHLIQTSIFGLQKVKSIDLLASIKTLQQKSQNALNLSSAIQDSDIEWLYDKSMDFRSMMELVEFSYEITDELEICIRIAPTSKSIEKWEQKGVQLKTIFYYEDMFEKSQMYLHVEEKDLKYTMNSEYLIFYDTEDIQFFTLD